MNENRLIKRNLLVVTMIIGLTLGCGFTPSILQAATPPPNPVNAEVNLHGQFSSSAVITPDGGTLSAQGTDGTIFTLSFPRYALSNDETITLTPITVINGLPFSGGLVGGVQMAPEGLLLLQPAILTIESPKTVAEPGFETVAFAYHQNGDGFYLNPSQVKGNLLTIEIWHFSGAGAVQGTPGEIQSQQQRVPSNAEDAFTQRVQEYLGRERQAQLLGQQDPDPNFQSTMAAFLREGYNSFIAPQLPVALRDCEAARSILSRALGWLRKVQLLGYDQQFQSESVTIMDTMNQAIVNCYNKEYDKCVVDKKIEHRVTMLGFYRQAALLGIDGQLDFSKIEKCPPATSYQASGQQEEMVYSGVICSLEQPFKVEDTSPYYAFTIQFTPSGPQAGSFSLSGTWIDVGPMDGGGSYGVNFVDTVANQLILQATWTTHTPEMDVSGGGTMNITLTPLGTGECGQP
jgi:hypothetical protein